MKQLFQIALIGLVLAGAFACASLALTLPTAVSTAAQMADQPDSVSDTVFESRKTAPVEEDNRGNWGLTLFAVSICALGGLVFFMRGGAEMLRQWRRTFKRRKQQQNGRYSAAPYRQEYEALPEPRRVGSARPVEETETQDYYETPDRNHRY